MSAEYYYRRQLGAKDLLPAVGVGVATGLAAFYIVQLLIQRTPLVPQGELPPAPAIEHDVVIALQLPCVVSEITKTAGTPP